MVELVDDKIQVKAESQIYGPLILRLTSNGFIDRSFGSNGFMQEGLEWMRSDYAPVPKAGFIED